MSKTTSPKALLALLNGHPSLRAMAKAARQAPPRQADNPLDCLPPALRERVTLVEESQRWLALVETSATAQLLRFHLPKLQQALPGQQVKIVVGGKRQPLGTAKTTLSGRPIPKLHRENAKQIEDLADAIDDEKLKASLKRLASRCEPE